tara:strand:+ start:409 stop:618 length:210 start_codon:yes stop_codon:yes gene_type:complete
VYPLGTLIAMTKDSGMRIRIDRELRDRFIEICKEQDKPAAQVIREYMRDYIKAYDDMNKTIMSDKNTED